MNTSGDRHTNEVVLIFLSLWMLVWAVLATCKISSLERALGDEHERYVKVSLRLDREICSRVDCRPISYRRTRMTKYDNRATPSH
jgi:hypothetical protein